MSDASLSSECSSGAERMRRHRQRRQRGLTCLTIDLLKSEIDALVRRDLLSADCREDRPKIYEAFYKFLGQTLGKAS